MSRTTNWNMEPARQALLRIGERTDSTLLAKIIESPGMSTRELAESLGWDIWKVDGSLRRLKHELKIEGRYRVDNGRAVKILYPKEGDKQEDGK